MRVLKARTPPLYVSEEVLKQWFLMYSDLPPLTSHLSPLTSHLPPLTSHLPPFISHFPSLTSHLSLPTSHLSPLTSHLLRPTFHLPPPTSHLSPPTSYLPPPTSPLLPPTSYLHAKVMILTIFSQNWTNFRKVAAYSHTSAAPASLGWSGGAEPPQRTSKIYRKSMDRPSSPSTFSRISYRTAATHPNSISTLFPPIAKSKPPKPPCLQSPRRESRSEIN